MPPTAPRNNLAPIAPAASSRRAVFNWQAKILMAWVGFTLAVIILADVGFSDQFYFWLNSLPYADKCGHLFFVFPLAFFTSQALKFRQCRWMGLNLQVGGLIIAAVMTLEECSQLLFPRRTFDLADMATNLFAVAVANVLANWCATRSQQRAKG